ncbi:MAG: hypothetical protein HHJ16_02910 [Polaromonas sp.]|uniref:hypothetical protein n=1 Tax=Polaromonas sp. TaxID=1869339 RepID=UPI00184CAE5F|nr:hypothetical protein [Polaromonas sp.]NMM09208.1 hypothetical protein [Polaromonas sp.]
MTIREQVEDASFLAQNGRHVGALTTLMLAVAASSRRTFPKGTKSREKPKEEMSDREAFTLFLGGRIRKILFGDFGAPDEGTSGISVGFRQAQHDVAVVLYKYYRCELVHDGELPEDVEFSAAKQPSAGLNISNRGLQVSISTGNKMVLDHGWIDLLREAVTNARCNGTEFGIQHFDLVLMPGIDEPTFLASLVEKYETSPGRVQILKHAVRKLSPESITSAAGDAIAKGFSALVHSQEINGGAITGLRSHGFTNDQGVLLQRGIELLREIASRYRLVAAS